MSIQSARPDQSYLRETPWNRYSVDTESSALTVLWFILFANAEQPTVLRWPSANSSENNIAQTSQADCVTVTELLAQTPAHREPEQYSGSFKVGPQIAIR